jgi:hypothetical protein
MSNSIVASQGLATVTLTAGQSIALNSLTETTVFEQVGFPNYPSQNDLEATFTGYDVLGPYASGATLVIEAGAAPVAYQVGIAPVVAGVNYQATPTSQDTTATLTTAKVMSGVITSTHTGGATITLTLPNGADMDLAGQFDVDEYFRLGDHQQRRGFGQHGDDCQRCVRQQHQRPHADRHQRQRPVPHPQDCGRHLRDLPPGLIGV